VNIKIKSILIQNFKGVKEQQVIFGENTKISGANATGKTTIFDAFTWLLFNKNSAGAEKFDIRPLDAFGNQIDNVEIKVVAVLDVDGKEVELSKVQKQNWVKKRGTDTSVLQGNVNSFEIDGYPKSEADYKSYISDLVNEDLFKMLTNPAYFVGMKWKDQRDILMKLVSDISDVELARENPNFADLLPELEKAPSTDDISKKFQKALSEWKKKQTEIPVRIDELSKSLVDVDVAEQELAKADLERHIAEIDQKIENAGSAVSDLMAEEMRLQMDMSGIMQTMNRGLSEKRISLENAKDAARQIFNNDHGKITEYEKKISTNKELLAAAETRKPDINQRWKENKESVFDETPFLFDESKWQFDESSTICSMCGQTLPDDRIEQLKADFERKKAAEKERLENGLAEAKKTFMQEKACTQESIKAEADTLKKKMEDLTKENASLQEQISTLKKKETEALAKQNEAEKELAELPAEADYSQNEEYVKLKARHEEITAQIEAMKSNTDAAETFKEERKQYVAQLDSVKAEIAKASKNVEIEERIGELESEQKEVGQKVADMEKMLYLLESFIKEKMMKISESINSKFNTAVSWKLFDMQLNGGVKECCECTVNGVPYSTLNSGHRIIVGLDIIQSLSDLYGATAPIFIDNAESINEFNLPDMDAQRILLAVSEDKELKFEMELRWSR
jgi:DNA repair exonuclease SbcCD ATPase subunit